VDEGQAGGGKEMIQLTVADLAFWLVVESVIKFNGEAGAEGAGFAEEEVDAALCRAVLLGLPSRCVWEIEELSK
jgi:hypothetical protein